MRPRFTSVRSASTRLCSSSSVYEPSIVPPPASVAEYVTDVVPPRYDKRPMRARTSSSAISVGRSSEAAGGRRRRTPVSTTPVPHEGERSTMSSSVPGL